jgi:quercetin dioxygenase-like cupin family protein
MKKHLFAISFAFLITGSLMLIGEDKPASTKQAKPAKETIVLKQFPVKFDKEAGAAIARIGVGHLHQLDATLVEIPPGGKLAPHKHFAEEMIYIVSGSGYTEMWAQDSGKKEKYEWKEGDLLSPTMNSWHQHFNSSPDKPARYLSVTTTPETMNFTHDVSVLNSSDHVFQDRWNKSIAQNAEYVGNAKVGPDTVRMNVGHLLPDLINRQMKPQIADNLGPESPRNRETGITIDPEGDMAGNHLIEMEVREFTKLGGTSPSHRHLWEVVYVILKGDGHETLEREGEADREFDWHAGDAFVVEAMEYHVHVPLHPGARFLQIKGSGYFRNVGIDKFMFQNKPKPGETPKFSGG